MQLLVGSKIINLDLRNPEDRALFTGVQKFLAILIGVFEASMLVMGGWYDPTRINPEATPLTTGVHIFLVVQLALGAIIVIYLDELVSKYGFGSGIGLFIAGGVSATIFWQALNPLESLRYGQISGAIPNLIWSMATGRGLSEAFLRQELPNMMGLLATIMVFLIVIYAENMRVEIPLAYGRFGGIRGRYPIRFLYASVIPVILAMVVFSNIRLFGQLLYGRGFTFLGTFDVRGNPISGLAYYVQPVNNIYQLMDDPLHGVIYLILLVGLCMAFAWLWIEMTGMGPRDIAEQLDRSGMLIPGFRRDIRVMERVLSRYIIAVTLLGGAFVGALSAIADFTGALGSGTGILLTVGILYGLYEEIARERVAEMFPAIRRFFGG
jgi:preprotein translocase subunit SecY